jgi:chromosome segregation protein
MHLQSLELFGFKSFADKTIFNFHEGVTAVVGPNGCGKSNVLDAVRWVLGEQSAKALRGGEMADVIFNGTDSRKPVGMAEVSLTFTDCASELGVDWHDVRVTRRVFRDGNSEYLLNKTVCRLKDIQSLFADTGVGRSAYSIMEQGKIDLILSSRPEDRRSVFEEAAGITKYKTQKREALRKLEATEANLLRLGDIVKEVKRQIGSLQRQAGKARRYQTLLADLQVLDTHHSRRKLNGLESEAAEAAAAITMMQEEERAATEMIEARERELSEKRHGLQRLDSELSDARAAVQRLQSEIDAHRRRIEFSHERAAELTGLIERARGEIETAEAKRTDQKSQLDETEAALRDVEHRLAGKRAELDETARHAAQTREERIERDRELQDLEISISKAEARVGALGDELSGIAARREATAARIAELDEAIAAASASREDARARLIAAQDARADQRLTVEQLLAAVQTAEAELSTQQQARSEAEKLLANTERTLTDKESRLEVLRQLNEEGEGLAKGSQAVLKGLHDPERIRPGVVGALVGQLDVGAEFVHAIEAALGRNIHAIVLRDASMASEIITTLTSEKLGQAALVLPDSAGGAIDLPTELPQPAIAWAIDQVRGAEELRNLVRQLLRGVAIVRNFADAMALRETHAELRIATLSGEFISAEGVIFGGSATTKTDSLLERKGRIAVLSEEQSTLQADRAELARRCAELQQQIEAAAARVSEARTQHQAANITHSSTEEELDSVQTEVHATERRLELIASEKSTLEQQLNLADARVAQLGSDVAAQQALIEDQTARRAEAVTARDNAHAGEALIAQQLADLRLALATDEQRQQNLHRQYETLMARLDELDELITSRQDDLRASEERVVQQTKAAAEGEAAIAAAAEQLKSAEKTFADLHASRSSHHSVLDTFEAALRSSRKSLNDIQAQRGHQEVRATQVQLRIDNLVEHAQRRYQLDLREFAPDQYAFAKTLKAQAKRRERPEEVAADAAGGSSIGDDVNAHASAGDFDDSQLEEIIADLTRQLDNMGPVNIDAVQEYDELEERHRFLETQNSDLTNSRRELLDVIARINSTTDKLFTETFAQVRINFREMFAELFGGGRADLALVDEADPLNCGIDIIAKPPGKQLQSVSLLSGGERTMTAVALLFAIYMVRPSPFCILDEMDAPLDESNINRFIKMLDRFVEQSQFIIITHNKRTIAKADVLYGVTMEERGVSKLVGMKLAADRGSDGALRADARVQSDQPRFPVEHADSERELALSR